MANTTNYNWETPDDTDLVKDGALAIRTLGNSIDTTTKNLNPETTTGDMAYRSATANTNTRLPIGTNGQILAVSSGVPAWINNDQGDITEVQAGTGISVASGTGPIPVVTNTVATAIDAKGDLIVGTGADTFARLAVGTNGHTLVADSAETTGLKWAAPAGGGKVAQVVSTTLTSTFTVGSDVYTDLTGLSVAITPTAATSKILVMISVSGQSNVANNYMHIRLMRGATAIGNVAAAGSRTTGFGWAASYPSASGGGNSIINNSYNFYDSPSTTSATTYKVQIRGTDGSTIYVNRSYTDTDNSEFLRTASTITVMEVLA